MCVHVCVFVCGLSVAVLRLVFTFPPPLLAVVVLATPSSMNPMDVPCHLSSGLSTCYFFKNDSIRCVCRTQRSATTSVKMVHPPSSSKSKDKIRTQQRGSVASRSGLAWSKGTLLPVCASKCEDVCIVCMWENEPDRDRSATPKRLVVHIQAYKPGNKRFTAHFTHRWPGR